MHGLATPQITTMLLVHMSWWSVPSPRKIPPRSGAQPLTRNRPNPYFVCILECCRIKSLRPFPHPRHGHHTIGLVRVTDAKCLTIHDRGKCNVHAPLRRFNVDDSLATLMCVLVSSSNGLRIYNDLVSERARIPRGMSSVKL